MKSLNNKSSLKELSNMEESVSKDILISEVLVWASRIGVRKKLKEIHIRPMKRKWASISTRGRLTLSKDLLYENAEVRRNVIVHELVHLRLRNGRHDKLFKALVKAYLSKYS